MKRTTSRHRQWPPRTERMWNLRTPVVLVCPFIIGAMEELDQIVASLMRKLKISQLDFEVSTSAIAFGLKCRPADDIVNDLLDQLDLASGRLHDRTE